MQKNQDCIFCRIIAGDIPADIVDQNDEVIVIKDIAPKAPIHYLIIPKGHIDDVSSLEAANERVCTSIFNMAQQLSKRQPEKGFRLVVNNGAEAGQSVFHLHCHFLSGKRMIDL